MSKKSTDSWSWICSDVQLHQSDELGTVFPWAYPLEITSGAIDPTATHKDLFRVQANTSKGLWNLHSIPESLVRPEELREFLEDMERRHRTPPMHWTTRSPTIVVRAHRASVQIATAPETTVEAYPHEDEEVIDDWRASPSEILTKLLEPSTSPDELFDAVLFAEIAAFDESQTEELLPRLFAFVKEHRFSLEDPVITAVGAAIRKLATNLRDCQFEEYAELFLPTDTDTLPCEIELELAKALLWRLTAVPPLLSRQFPELESRLSELALDYLKPRLILQKKYASVALHAALDVLLLNGERANSVADNVNNLGIGWFSDLFQRRLGRLCVQLDENSDDGSAPVAARLRRFEAGSGSE